MATIPANQQQRYDTAANWTANDPTLAAGEMGVESDTDKIKIGDGSTAWTSLSYLSPEDANAIHDNVSGEIAALTEKASPASADLLLIEDSAASNAKKKVQVGNLGGTGDVSGPASSTDNALARFDGTGGKTIQNSGWALDDSNALSAGGKLAMADQEVERPKIKDYGETLNAIGSVGGGTQDINFEAGNVHSLTVDTSETTLTLSNPPASGVAGSLTLYIENGGSQTFNWPASVDFGDAGEPSLQSDGLDIVILTTLDGGTSYQGMHAYTRDDS